MFYFLLAMPGGEGAGALPNSSADTSNVRGALFALPPHQEPEAVQVATLLTVVGAEARKDFATFTDCASDTDQNKIQPVLQTFAAYCQPLKNVPFERIGRVLRSLSDSSSTVSEKVGVRIDYSQSNLT